MASYKNQHFVPRCYLKPFTYLAEGLSINLFNVDRQKCIRNAPVKNQCSKDYFYGKDLRLESLLRAEEGQYAKLLNEICSPNYRVTESTKTALRRFCLLQHCRTEGPAIQAVKYSSELADIAFRGEAHPDWHTTLRDAVLMGMHAFATALCSGEIDDLKVCLVRNQTSRSFVTSDDPAVVTNKWYQTDKRARGLSGGIGSAGVLVFLPLTSRILCVLYDGDVYSIPNECGWVNVNKTFDIDALNQHQFLGCTANVYFSGWDQQTEIADAFKNIAACRPVVRHQLITAVLDKETDWGKSYRVVPRAEIAHASEVFVHWRSIRPQPSRWPSIVKWRNKPKIYSNGSGTGFVRHSRADPAKGYTRVT